MDLELKIRLSRMFRVCTLEDDVKKYNKSNYFEISNKYDFIVALGPDCFFFGKASKFLASKELVNEPSDAPENVSDLDFLQEVEVADIFSVSLSSCETCIAVTCPDRILFFSSHSLSKGRCEEIFVYQSTQQITEIAWHPSSLILAVLEKDKANIINCTAGAIITETISSSDFTLTTLCWVGDRLVCGTEEGFFVIYQHGNVSQTNSACDYKIISISSLGDGNRMLIGYQDDEEEFQTLLKDFSRDSEDFDEFDELGYPAREEAFNIQAKTKDNPWGMMSACCFHSDSLKLLELGSLERVDIADDYEMLALGISIADEEFAVGSGWLCLEEKPNVLLYSSSGVLFFYQLTLLSYCDKEYKPTKPKPIPRLHQENVIESESESEPEASVSIPSSPVIHNRHNIRQRKEPSLDTEEKPSNGDTEEDSNEFSKNWPENFGRILNDMKSRESASIKADSPKIQPNKKSVDRSLDLSTESKSLIEENTFIEPKVFPRVSILTQNIIEVKNAEIIEIMLLQEISKDDIIRMFKRGMIQLNLQSQGWNKCLRVLETLPEAMKTIPTQNKTLQKQNELEKEQLELIEKQITQLQAQKQKLGDAITKRSEIIANSSKAVELWDKMKIEKTITKQMEGITRRLSDIEQEIGAEVCSIIKSNPRLFVSITKELPNEVPLSLVFNAAGIPENEIMKLATVDGRSFLASNSNFSSFCEFYSITDFHTQKNLFYIRHMLQEKQIPNDPEHILHCEICSCDTAKKLCSFLEERKLKLLPYDIILNNNINGKRVLGLNYDDLTKIFHLDMQDSQIAMSTVSILMNIHYDAIEIQSL